MMEIADRSDRCAGQYQRRSVVNPMDVVISSYLRAGTNSGA
jgi:hypothetical protein